MKVLLSIPGINSLIHKKINAQLTDSLGGRFREIVIGGAAAYCLVLTSFGSFAAAGAVVASTLAGAVAACATAGVVDA